MEYLDKSNIRMHLKQNYEYLSHYKIQIINQTL